MRCMYHTCKGDCGPGLRWNGNEVNIALQAWALLRSSYNASRIHFFFFTFHISLLNNIQHDYNNNSSNKSNSNNKNSVSNASYNRFIHSAIHLLIHSCVFSHCSHVTVNKYVSVYISVRVCMFMCMNNNASHCNEL